MVNENGKEISKFNKPIYYEKPDKQKPKKTAVADTTSSQKERRNTSIGGGYRIEQQNGRTAISVVVPIFWLADKDRQYPVVIDPTQTNTYNNGTINTCHDNFGGSPNYIKFNN